MATRTLSATDHKRVTAAIRAAEKNTAGEIYCVVARASDSYFFPAAFLLSAFLLLASLLAALAIEYAWLTVRLPWFVAIQLVALASVVALLQFLPGTAIRLVPRRLAYRRAHDNALKQFLARNVHITQRRTGVLIFVSLAERYAEVIADSGINAKVPQAEWDGIVGGLILHAREDRLADGYVAAIGAVGALLAAHFPVGARDANELDDHLVEL